MLRVWNFTAPESEMIANQNLMTDEFIPSLQALAPTSGCYLNEVRASTLTASPVPPLTILSSQGDFRQPNFTDVFYGINYPALRSIKAKYDPNDIFYATTAVGSDEWTVLNDGRLCKL